MMARVYMLIVVALFAAAVGGCKSGGSAAPSAASSSGQNAKTAQAPNPTDPCPERLHNLAGALLQFLVQYDRLPPTLEDLTPLKGTTLETACPATNQKYIYNPNGVKLPPARWAIVYDAAPSHSGTRWVIVFSPGKEGQPPVPAVVSISEAEFRAATEMPGLGR
jgi:hypothetical protein